MFVDQNACGKEQSSRSLPETKRPEDPTNVGGISIDESHGVWKFGNQLLIRLDYLTCLRLTEEDLGYDEFVWISGPPPRKYSFIVPGPGKYRSPHFCQPPSLESGWSRRSSKRDVADGFMLRQP